MGKKLTWSSIQSVINLYKCCGCICLHRKTTLLVEVSRPHRPLKTPDPPEWLKTMGGYDCDILWDIEINIISYTVSSGRNTESSRVWNGNLYWARRSRVPIRISIPHHGWLRIMPQTDCVTNLSRWKPLQCFLHFIETLTYDIAITSTGS
jgi:hypothetical protein